MSHWGGSVIVAYVTHVNPSVSDLGEAVVTGASEGIGETFARELAARGFDLLLVARRLDRLEQLAAELTAAHGRRIRVLRADLSTPEGVEATSRAALADQRVPSLLVNNAGFGAVAKTIDTDEVRLVEMVRLNIEAVMVLSHRIGREMFRTGRGSIINVASTAAFQPCPGFATYAATKAFVLSFSEALHHELKDRVQVLALCPGYTRSGFHRVAGMENANMKFPAMDSAVVVADALDALQSERAVKICGKANYAMVFLVRLVPRSWVRAIAARVFQVRR